MWWWRWKSWKNVPQFNKLNEDSLEYQAFEEQFNDSLDCINIANSLRSLKATWDYLLEREVLKETENAQSVQHNTEQIEKLSNHSDQIQNFEDNMIYQHTPKIDLRLLNYVNDRENEFHFKNESFEEEKQPKKLSTMRNFETGYDSFNAKSSPSVSISQNKNELSKLKESHILASQNELTNYPQTHKQPTNQIQNLISLPPNQFQKSLSAAPEYKEDCSDEIELLPVDSD